MIQLKTPLTTGKLKLKNRLIMPPIATAKSSATGQITREILKHYDEKTRGGCLSLVIVEHCFITNQGKARDLQMSIADDSTLEGFGMLVDVLHANKVKAVAQINHAGSGAAGEDRIAPSAVVNPFRQLQPKEAMTKEQIDQVILDFKDAAVRAKKAGFDGVEIHSAHGYLLNQFYSPLTNLRTDEYGGSLNNRIRIHLEIIAAVREAVGADFPILLRLGGCDYTEGGSTVEDSVAAARAFEGAGVDIMDISGGFCGYINPNSTEAGYFSDVSAAIREAVSIPVILAGGITTPQQAEELLARGAADLIGVGRAILADSSWPEKAFDALA